MGRGKVIPFEPQEQILQRARAYLDSVELFLEEPDRAVPILLRAMRHADRRVRHDIMLLLGSFAKQEAAWPLYEMMIDPRESEDCRHDISIQLSVIGPFLKDPRPLVDRLLEDLAHEDPLVRMNAAFALGWEGNDRAAIPLIGRLYDPDTRVQQCAVSALANLRDDRILGLMLERLEHGSKDQKRAILFNLWRFDSRRDEVIPIYLAYCTHQDEDLRFDAIVLLGLVAEAGSYREVYLQCLSDPDPRIRALALRELGELAKEDLLKLKGRVARMLDDPEMGVKRAAMEVLNKL